MRLVQYEICSTNGELVHEAPEKFESIIVIYVDAFDGNTEAGLRKQIKRTKKCNPKLMQTEYFLGENISAYMLGSRSNQLVFLGLFRLIIRIEITNSVILSRVKTSHQDTR